MANSSKEKRQEMRLLARKKILEDAATMMFEHAGTDAGECFMQNGEYGEFHDIFESETKKIALKFQKMADKVIV
jgi:hypothetical protein